jgi:hypothetical protein
MTEQKSVPMSVRELETNPAAKELVRRLNDQCFPTSEESKAPHGHSSDSGKEQPQIPSPPQ